MSEGDLVISPEELARHEAAYIPLPSFADWAAHEVTARDYWDEAVRELFDLRERVGPAELERSVSVALRAAALETGLIEGLYSADRGLTMTVATQAAAWEQQLRDGSGDDAYALFKAQLSAYELVLDAVTNHYPVTEAWLRSLHETLTEPQDTYAVYTLDGGKVEHPMLRGRYKEHPNHVRLRDGLVHVYAPVIQTAPEMERFVAELQTAGFGQAHSVLQAAYAHYGVVSIHPFCDGNGRVARALASVYTYRAASVPLLVFSDEREVYFDALAAADQGDPGPFVQLVFDAAAAGITLVAENLRTALAPAPAAAVDSLKVLLTAQGGLTYNELDQVALNVVDQFGRILREAVAKHPYPSGVSVAVGGGSGSQASAPDGFRPIVIEQRYITLLMTSGAPATARREPRIDVFIAMDEARRDVFWLLMPGTDIGLHLTLRDAHPTITIATGLKMQALAERILGQALDGLLGDADAAFRQSGYRP